ncbi:MAG: hypothetical protein ACKVVP_24575, partial [Chloroflexota bacterium]
ETSVPTETQVPRRPIVPNPQARATVLKAPAVPVVESAAADASGDDDLQPEAPLAEPLTLDRVRGSWDSVVGAVGSQNGPLGAVLAAAQPMTVDGATIILGVPYAFHVRLIQEQAKRRTIEDVWSRILGSRVRLECRPAQEEQRAHPSAVAIDDPVVRAALEIFGGEATVIQDED